MVRLGSPLSCLAFFCTFLTSSTAKSFRPFGFAREHILDIPQTAPGSFEKKEKRRKGSVPSEKRIGGGEIDLRQHFVSLIQHSFHCFATLTCSGPSPPSHFLPSFFPPVSQKKSESESNKSGRIEKSSALLAPFVLQAAMKNVVHESEPFCSRMFQLFNAENAPASWLDWIARSSRL